MRKLIFVLSIFLGASFLLPLLAQDGTSIYIKGGGGSSSLAVGTTVITGGTNTRCLFDDNGVIGESAGCTYVKGTGTLTTTNIVSGIAVFSSITTSSLTSGRVTFAGASGLLSDDSDFTFAVDTATITKIVGSTSITDSGLTATRCTFAGTGGLLSDDADCTFSGGDTLTVTKLSAPTSVTVAGATASSASPQLLIGSVGYGLSFYTNGSDGLLWGNGGSNFPMYLNLTKLSLTNAQAVGWTNSATNGATGTFDTALSKVSAGVVGVGTGAAGSVAGTIQAALFQAPATAGFANFLGTNSLANGGSTLELRNDQGVNAYMMNRMYGSTSGATLFGASSVNFASFFADGASLTGLGIGTLTADPVIIGTNNTAVLTISSAQISTFAGTVTFSAGDHTFYRTITAGGTTGNQTINKLAGTVNIAAAGTTITVTNSLCTTSSIIHAVLRTNDATARIANVVPGSGSFVINLTAAATAETSVGFLVTN